MARLLLVEDDQTIGDALRTSLSAHGHDVRWERTGRGALVCTDAFDLVLLDLGLPDLDGIEVCRRLRADLPAAVLVILTARTDEMDVVVGLEAGADDYLTKPVRLAELHARLRAHLRRNARSGSAASRVRRSNSLARIATSRPATVTRRASGPRKWQRPYHRLGKRKAIGG